MNVEDQIRDRLIKAIKQSGLKQKEIAKQALISNATLSDYIHKNKFPTLTTFAKLCEVLDVSADYILGLKEY